MFASLMRKRSRVRKRVASVRARNARNSGFTGVDKIVVRLCYIYEWRSFLEYTNFSTVKETKIKVFLSFLYYIAD